MVRLGIRTSLYLCIWSVGETSCVDGNYVNLVISCLCNGFRNYFPPFVRLALNKFPRECANDLSLKMNENSRSVSAGFREYDDQINSKREKITLFVPDFAKAVSDQKGRHTYTNEKKVHVFCANFWFSSLSWLWLCWSSFPSVFFFTANLFLPGCVKSWLSILIFYLRNSSLASTLFIQCKHPRELSPRHFLVMWLIRHFTTSPCFFSFRLLQTR